MFNTLLSHAATFGLFQCIPVRLSVSRVYFVSDILLFVVVGVRVPKFIKLVCSCRSVPVVGMTAFCIVVAADERERKKNDTKTARPQSPGSFAIRRN